MIRVMRDVLATKEVRDHRLRFRGTGDFEGQRPISSLQRDPESEASTALVLKANEMSELHRYFGIKWKLIRVAVWKFYCFNSRSREAVEYFAATLLKLRSTECANYR